ncbi:MAG: protein-export chaperone SecB [Methylophilaceae bacterium]|nr:protein-export chaperone SecB [Methylophilaceae bacterium]
MAEEQQPQEAQPPIFSIEKIYVKDMSLEAPNVPQIFLQHDNPQVNIELQNKTAMVDDGVFEVVVTITVTSKIQDKVAFLVEVAQAGIFVVRNMPQEALSGILGVACPNILFPYAREAISSTVVRAGFPPLLLNPINFEALYAQQLHQQQQQASENATATTS